MIAGEQGRLLFPAAAAVATILAVGWSGWLPRRLQEWAALAIGAAMLAVGIWQYQTVQTTYATPPALAAPVTPERTVDATFSGGMQLVGFDLPDGAATDFGKPLPVTLYFRAVEPVPEDYTLFIHLVGSDDRILYQFDGIPYGGRHPPRQWQVGEIFADRYEIYPKLRTSILPASRITDTLATLTLGFYPVLRPQERLEVLDANGNPAGDRVQLAKIRILPEETVPASADRGRAGGRRRLACAMAERHRPARRCRVGASQRQPQSLQLRWKAPSKTGSVITRSSCRRWMPAAAW